MASGETIVQFQDNITPVQAGNGGNQWKAVKTTPVRNNDQLRLIENACMRVCVSKRE